MLKKLVQPLIIGAIVAVTWGLLFLLFPMLVPGGLALPLFICIMIDGWFRGDQTRTLRICAAMLAFLISCFLIASAMRSIAPTWVTPHDNSLNG